MPELKAAGLFKYVWPFSGHQAYMDERTCKQWVSIYKLLQPQSLMVVKCLSKTLHAERKLATGAGEDFPVFLPVGQMPVQSQ